MPTPLYLVDAFADAPFTGNPAGVCLLDKPRDEKWMQAVAMEMNQAETAFLVSENDGYRLRWFTPELEVDLCGHATLASAHVLFETGKVKPTETARFFTRSGLLTVTKQGELLTMDFPAEPVKELPSKDVPAELLKGLGCEAKFIGKNRMDLFVEIPSAKLLRQLKPDLSLWKTIPTRGVIVTCRSDDPRFDFLSRFFAPAAGVPEDPVTGSAHCALGPYWGEKLKRMKLYGFQESKRGGVVVMLLKNDRVLLSGKARIVLKGDLV